MLLQNIHSVQETDLCPWEMHHICNFVRNKNMTSKKHKKHLKNKKKHKTCFLNFNKNIKNVYYIYDIMLPAGEDIKRN